MPIGIGSGAIGHEKPQGVGTAVVVISNTSAITNLAAIQHLHQLTQLYNQVTIPEAVERELADIDPPVPETRARSSCYLA